tara:strand:- start:4144 stop:4617 length:474 start_codon:yes stop_codon:yes gene_type:complete
MAITTAAGISATTVTTDQQAPLGFELVVPTANQGEQVWIYIFNDEAALQLTQGMLIMRDLATATYDGIRSTGAVSPQRIIGVAQHNIAAQSYGFILRKGIGQVLCDGNVTADTAVCPDANAGQCTDVAAVTNAAIGVALATDAGAATLVAAHINCTG